MSVLKRLQISVLTLSLCATASAALAKPPEGMVIDPEVHKWFEALVRADGAHCCSDADCRIAASGEVRTSANGFEIMLNGEWEPVPESLMVHRESGPFAATIVCKTHFKTTALREQLYCVVPYAGG